AMPTEISRRIRTYEPFLEEGRKERLKLVKKYYELFLKDRVLYFPTEIYGAPLGKLFKVEVEDFPTFGEVAYLEFDSARTVLIMVDWQADFAAKGGYIDVMGYDIETIRKAIEPAKKVLEASRKAGIKVIYTREGHERDLSDAPFNKILRSKIIGKGVGIGEAPPGGSGMLLVKGEPGWEIINELYPQPGDIVIDKPSKGAFHHSPILHVLMNIFPPPTHIVLTGLTTDVCVHTIMREANDFGYWVLLLKDATMTTDYENYLAAIKQIKMSGGIFGWVSDSEKYVKGLKEAGLI
ncbi:MAG: isochorismatase family cysteine hydrolase, partial [Desulfurococcaceae archaeon]